MPEPATHSELADLIARCLHVEARLMERHADRCAAGQAIYATIPPTVGPCPPYADPHYWTRVEGDQLVFAGNAAWERANAVRQRRRRLEGELEGRSLRAGAGEDPFAEVSDAR